MWAWTWDGPRRPTRSRFVATRLTVVEMTTIRAAWFTFPDLVVRPAHQQYRRTGELTGMYESGDFATVNRSGFVLQIW